MQSGSNTAYTIPSQTKPKLFKHQIEGGNWLAGQERAGLFDKTGLGKTGTLIHGLDMAQAIRGIVVTTTTSQENWKREFNLWQKIPRSVVKYKDNTTILDWIRGLYDVLIISYDMGTRKRDTINHYLLRNNLPFFDFGLMDEAHYAKNIQAARTVAMRGHYGHGGGGIFQNALRAWEATGTPIPNDPRDLWAFLRFARVYPRSEANFISEFLFRERSRFKVLPNKISEIRRMMQQASIMRTEADGVDIPPIVISQDYIDGDASKVKQFIADHPGIDSKILDALNQGNLKFLDAPHQMQLARLIGEAKALPFAAHLIDKLNGGLDKAVVFAHHKTVLDMVAQKLGAAGIGYVRIDGSVPAHKRSDLVDIFQNKLECRVFLGNIRAAGEAITLTAANHLYMLESLWTPKDNAQPIMRISRIGQKRNTWAFFVTLVDSFDESIISLVRAKATEIIRLTDHVLLAAPA